MSTSKLQIMGMVLSMFWVMAFFFQDIAQAEIHYINSQDFWADDSNSGSVDQPLRTISEGLRRAQPGDTILVAPGTYRESLEFVGGGNSPEEAISLRAETSGSVFVMGSDIVTGWEPAFDQIWVKYDWAYNSQQVYAGGVQLEQVGPNSLYHSLALEGGNALPVTGTDISDMFSGSFWYDTKVGALYVWLPDGSSPQEYVMEVSARPYILSSQGIDYIHMEGLVFAHSSTGTSAEEISMVNISGSNWNLKDNYFLSADMSGLTLSGRNHQLEENAFILNGLAGFYIWGNEGTAAGEDQNIIISGNETSHNNTRGFHFLLNPGGASLTRGCSQVEIDRHLAWHNKMFGLVVDSDCGNVSISRSFFSDNVIALYSNTVRDLYADNNIFSNNNYAIGLDTLAGSHFSFNTFHSNYYGIQLMDSTAGNPGNLDNHINNNVFSDNHYSDVGIYDSGFRTRDNSLNFNAYVRADFDMINLFSDDFGFIKLVTSLADFQDQTGFDQDSAVSSSIWLEDEYNFFPPVSSVLVNAGQYLNLVVPTDFYGLERPYGSGPDMGAVEYRSDMELADYPHDLQTGEPVVPVQPDEPEPPLWTLSLSVVGQGSISNSPDLIEYEHLQVVQLAAIPQEGWYFDQWEGDLSGSNESVEILMDNHKSVTARFDEYMQLDVQIIGEGGVVITPDSPLYEQGEQVQLSAEPSQQWEFSGWSGDVSGTDPLITLTMDQNKLISATFEYMEPDPELLGEVFVFDPNTYVSGQNPVGSTLIQRRTGSNDFGADTAIMDMNTPVGIKGLRLSTDVTSTYNSGADRWLLWNEVPTDLEEVEFLYLFRRSHAGDTELLGTMRMSGSGALEAYAAGLRNNQDEIRARRVLSNEISNAGNVNHNLLSDTVNDWIWVRGRMEPGSYVIKAKTWLYGNQEPDGWMLEWQDADAGLLRGGAGLQVYLRRAGDTIDLAWWSVGTDGAFAPGPDEYMEPDPELLGEVFVFDPNTYVSGQNPVGSTLIQRRTGSNDFGADTAIMDMNTPVGIKGLRLSTDVTSTYNSGADRWLLWNEVPTDLEEVEFLYLFRRSHAGDTEFLGCMRMSSDGAFETYAAGLRNNQNEIRGRRVLGNEISLAGNTDHNLLSDTVNDWIWVRGRMEPGSYIIKAKTWLYGNQEPDGWMLEWQDADAGLLRGGAGLQVYLRRAGDTIDLAWWSVGTNGDIAPYPEDVVHTTPEPEPEPVIYYELQVNVSGEGVVQISPESEQYEQGDSVQLVADPAEQWEFSGWSGDVSGTDPLITLTMDQNKLITATFEYVEPELQGEVFVFDPNTYDSGQNLVGSTLIQRRTGSNDFGADTAIVDMNTPVGIKGLRLSTDVTSTYNSGADRWLLWNEVPTDLEEVEFLYLFRRSHAGDTELLGCMRMSSDGAFETYAAGLRNNQDEIRARRVLSNEISNAGNVNHNLSSDTVNDWIWVRGRMEPGSYVIKAKTWLYGNQEPDGWMLEWQDADAGLLRGGAGLQVYLRKPGDTIDLAWWSVGTDGAPVPVPDDVVRTEPESEPDTTFPVEVYGEYFDSAWVDSEPGLIRDLNYGNPSSWPRVNGDTNRIVIMNQETVTIKDMKAIIFWDRSRDKYGTTFIHIRNCEEVYLEDLHFLQASPEYRGSQTIFVEDSGKVVLKNSSFHGAVHPYHVRMEGNREVIIDNIEIAGYNYGGGIVRTGGGIWIENGEGNGLERIASPNPRDLEWFQVTNSYIHDSHSNPETLNHDGILVHSGSNGLIYNCLIQNWTARDSGFDVSHRRTDTGYSNRTLRIEKNNFINNQYVKAPGKSNSSNEILFINNNFEKTSFGIYHGLYTVRFKNCTFDESYLATFLALWNVSGPLIYEECIFMITSLWSLFREGGTYSPLDHTYLRGINNTYYVGSISYWVNGFDVKIRTWREWLDLGQETGSVLRDISEIK